MQVSELRYSVSEPSMNAGFRVEHSQSKASSTNKTRGKCFSIVPTFIPVTQSPCWRRGLQINYFQVHIFPMTQFGYIYAGNMGVIHVGVLRSAFSPSVG
jgi:hypothetical protein